MTRDEFSKKYSETVKRAIVFAEKARKEGLLALEEELDDEMAKNRDIFEYGVRFAIDGFEKAFIDKVLSNIIVQENDEYARKLKLIQKEAVLLLQEGTGPRFVLPMLNSYTEYSLNNDPLLSQYLSSITKEGADDLNLE